MCPQLAYFSSIGKGKHTSDDRSRHRLVDLSIKHIGTRDIMGQSACSACCRINFNVKCENQPLAIE
ncbi:unnamed protein product [Hymenolepis diminuta]|uniref:Uncharacterized protein n=1 Tax=Hymenolepis diminuta TaxID=6216 RepID=A0A564Y1P7_HYMDI|nr:unnamed protein product [Hymenolepis diminuta]